MKTHTHTHTPFSFSLSQSMFTHGNTIFIQSVVSGNNLRINNGEVEGTGRQDKLAQFIVHDRRPGVVALQNVNASDSYLAIYDGRTIGTVSMCHVNIHIIYHDILLTKVGSLLYVVWLMYGYSGVCMYPECIIFLSNYREEEDHTVNFLLVKLVSRNFLFSEYTYMYQITIDPSTHTCTVQ